MSNHNRPTGRRPPRQEDWQNYALTPFPLPVPQHDGIPHLGAAVPKPQYPDRPDYPVYGPSSPFIDEYDYGNPPAPPSSPQQPLRRSTTSSTDARSRSESFIEKLELQRKKLELKRITSNEKRKAKSKKPPRDKSARPERADVLDKPQTGKLRKFWAWAVRSKEDESDFTTSPPTGPFGTSLEAVDEGPSLPQTAAEERAIDYSAFAQVPPGRRNPRHRAANMDTSRLAPSSAEGEKKKQEAIQDAKDMYQAVLRNCERTNRAVPPYDFIELIGKGGSGRVYKCRDRRSGNLVAVKIIDTDAADYDSTALDKDDTIRDFRKEVSTLQQLKDSQAKNVNMIHHAFDIQEQLWIICEYCTGGSVRTLMRANPGGQGLEEQYIIPIARELAVALKSVHDVGVIHRDIKCTNVYVTEDGFIQLGDFGIVGVLDDEGSKRRTIVGTPHYMPRELIAMEPGNQASTAYGSEVDIWSFGCTVFEMATGLPPNAYKHPNNLGSVLVNAPRLEGGNYSQLLRDFVAFCLNSDPEERPTADAVLKHPYIANTAKKYPTKNLVNLIHRYKVWEYGGGYRQSLFMAGGAPPASASSEHYGRKDQDSDDWNFSTSDSFNEDFEKRYSQMVLDDPPDLRLDTSGGGDLPRLDTSNLTPLERAHQELSASRGEQSLQRLWNPDSAPYQLHEAMDDRDELPLRSMNEGTSTRESHIMIDLDEIGGLGDSEPTFNFDFGDIPTVKARQSRMVPREEDEEDDDYAYGGQSEEDRDKRATMDWKFPSTAKRATMDWTFPSREPTEPQNPDYKMEFPPAGEARELAPAFRPTLKHATTEPIGEYGNFVHAQMSDPTSASPARESMHSMINLDLDYDDPSEIPRPSTASSATGSTSTEMTSGNPFDLEEDPAQNEMDRNRFSHHKPWQSEGGQQSNRSSRRSVPMHARGNSLSSTDDDLDRSVASGDDMFNYEYTQRLTSNMTDQLNGHHAPPHSNGTDPEDWPRLRPEDGFDDETSFPRPNGDQAGIPAGPHAATQPHDHIDFPAISPPNAEALHEDAEAGAVIAELDRMLADFGESLEATAQALQAHAEVVFEEGDSHSAGTLSESEEGY